MKSTTLFIAVLITLLFTSCVEQQTPNKLLKLSPMPTKTRTGKLPKKMLHPWN